MRPRRFGLLLAAVVATSCNRPSTLEEPRGAPLVELRDSQGRRSLAVWKVADGFRWADAQEGPGHLSEGAGGRLSGHDPRHGPLEASLGEPGGLQLRRRDGSGLRLSREGLGLRLGDAAGIPIARARMEKEEAQVHDAGGIVVLRARQAGGRIVVTDRDGGAVAFVLGQATLDRAALASLSTLSAVERVLVLVTGER